MSLSVLLLALAAAPLPPTVARVDTCAALPEPQRARALALLDRLHPYDCCDGTLHTCLADTAACPVVTRLVREVCTGVAAGKSDGDIELGLTRRGQSVLGVSRPVTIANDPATCAGEPAAPLVVTVYACARCPFCARLIPALHREIVEGTLRGKARLCFRLFPIKDHPGSLDGGLAMQAAARGGAFWPYTLHIYDHFDRFEVARLDSWAETVGLSRASFAAARADPATREAVAASKREGLRNKVTSTPTVFIDGRRYVHTLELATLVDVIDEIHAARRSAPAAP